MSSITHILQEQKTQEKHTLTLVEDSSPLGVPKVDSQAHGLIWSKRFSRRLAITDTLVIIFALGISLLYNLGYTSKATLFRPLTTQQIATTFIVLAIWVLTLLALRTRDSKVVGIGSLEYKRIVNASALTFGFLAIVFLVINLKDTRGFFLLSLPVGTAALLIERWFWRKWLLRQRHFGHYLSRAIVVGTQDDVEYVIDQIAKNSGASYRVVCAIIDTHPSTYLTANGHTIPVIPHHDNIAETTRRLGADAVIIAGNPKGGAETIRNIGWELETTEADLVLSSRLTDVAGPRIHFRPVEGLPLIHVEIPQFDGGKHGLKRTFDILVSGTALIVLLPLLLVIAIIVRLDSPGPLIFRQARVGRNGEPFHMVKFRSMIKTAEDDLAGLLDQNESGGILFKLRNDPRITRVGRILRKYSLDELPQLWNILIGDMSLVGPRPPLPSEVEKYEKHVNRRLYIKPGLTGMWQVSGRSNLTWEESVRLDLYYVENWSITGDLMIVWRTFKTVIKPEGAY